MPRPIPSTLLHLGSAALVFAFASAVPAHADDAGAGIDAGRVQATRSIAAELLTRLGQKLKASMANDGPVAAVSVCKDAAPAIAMGLSAQYGAQVTRVGTRVRNPRSGVPNDWQKAALAEFKTRIEKGEKPADLEYWKVAEGSDGKPELRYAKAIITQPLCMSCHGKTEDMPAPLLERIRADYPQDQATGYSVGELRGAVVITRPM